jgi:hypothetical protein
VHKIRFKYNDSTHEAIARKFTSKKHRWYLITVDNSPNFVIAPAVEHARDSKALWIQENIPGEMVHPEEFIQAIGSSLEAAGIL